MPKKKILPHASYNTVVSFQCAAFVRQTVQPLCVDDRSIIGRHHCPCRECMPSAPSTRSHRRAASPNLSCCHLRRYRSCLQNSSQIIPRRFQLAAETERERKREREREKGRKIHRETEKEPETEPETEPERETKRERDKERERDRERNREKDKERHRERDREIWSDQNR